jgi:hypothetical protein
MKQIDYRHGWTFWRVLIECPQDIADSTQIFRIMVCIAIASVLCYIILLTARFVQASDFHTTFSLTVPARKSNPRIMFFSCNHEDRNIPSLWTDVLKKHEAEPFHLMLGGGDQIYNVCVIARNSSLVRAHTHCP